MPRLRRSRRAIGPIDGRDPEKVIPVPGSDDSIVLLDIDATPGQESNLLRVRPDGSIVWRAGEPPDTEPRSIGAWVTVRWRRRRGLWASSWSCYLCEIDSETGEILSSAFTK